MTQPTDLKERLLHLPQETGIYTVAPGIDVVVHLLNADTISKGTLWDVKDRHQLTIYRIRRNHHQLDVEVYYSDRLTTDHFTLSSTQVIDGVLEIIERF